MKKITCFVLAIILAFSMAACAKSSADAPAADTNNVTGKEKDFTIVYVGGETSSPWYLQVEKGMNEWAKSTGMNGSFRGTASSDPTEAVSLIKDLTAQKVDAILVGVDCQDAVEPALADARAAGILVVSTEGTGMTNIDFDVEPCNNSYYGRFQSHHIHKVFGDSFALTPFFCGYAAICTAAVDYTYNRAFEFFSLFHEPERFSVALRTRTAEMTFHTFFNGISAFHCNCGYGRTVQHTYAADYGCVVRKSSVAVKLDKIVKNIVYIICAESSFRISCRHYSFICVHVISPFPQFYSF